ncbi:imidazole glycerol phosphate synthase subunit HisF [Pseudoalteromonas denitrificans]|uniref:imidazole glycerol-phosphate synthase n=1 Tax=Pseudoalteromonas denitrificans DSM 6059 TaxID=1123010 RepID=A0A1I1HKD1_9GAMM|nr:imidazole glycerol phosphate synthase cyclase subunit [Pseudoalteromonas denitrificans]SFC24527.1 cyclase [Pseudoalteromonas denitrificans DSM 6059]
MLKKRVVPILLLKNGRLVKGVKFNHYRDVGDPIQSAAVYNSQTADELIILDINATQESYFDLLKILAELTKSCFMPLALGGGIRTFDQAAQLIHSGADKIVLNTICYQKPELVSELAKRFGSQAIVCNIDVRKHIASNNYILYSHSGKTHEKVSLAAHLKKMLDAGVGEFMVQSIDRDGTMLGFDQFLVDEVMSQVKTPLLIAGGSGNYQHLHQIFTQTNVSGVVCGSLFNFSDSSPIRARAYLLNYGLPFKLV